MPKKLPGYLLHKPSGNARVRLNGKDIYLGPYGSDESRRAYARVIAEHVASQGQAFSTSLTIDELCLLYLDFAEGYYRKNGRQTSEYKLIRDALRPVVYLYGPTKPIEFGPLALKAVRQQTIEAGLCRNSINKYVERIRRMFRWATENEYVPVSTFQALKAVRGLAKGRTEAKEREPVKPVPPERIEAIRPYVSRQVWAAVQLQLLTGGRPGEILALRLCNLKRTGAVWEYVPAEHKTEHGGFDRVLWLGPQAQAVVAPFLNRGEEDYLLSPREGLEEHRSRKRAARKTSLTPSQLPRRPKAKPQYEPGDRYSIHAYRNAIIRACERALAMPNDLRRISE